ncbi:MAG: dihydroorotate dehydrogenase electron transfer subunit [Thermoleophilia bacterium]|nr:dihydroorotate dehydrogenase electron transfer subunit [Thermoleophilia bacterium]
MDAQLIPASLFDCPVVESRPVGAYRLISFVAREIAALARPGQFLMVRAAGQKLDPLLPRPLGVHEIDSDLVKVLIEPVGRGTISLAGMRVGDRLSVLGPLGNGFDMTGEGPAIVVGGGIGAAPLAFVARSLSARGRDVRCLLGFRSRGQAVVAELFRNLPVEVYTEDGSMGKKGLVSAPLSEMLCALDGTDSFSNNTSSAGDFPSEASSAETISGDSASSDDENSCAADTGMFPEIFACGPDPMLAAVDRICRDCGANAQVSVAAHMACGVGACQGCVIKTVDGYRRACSEGPVFPSTDIEW